MKTFEIQITNEKDKFKFTQEITEDQKRRIVSFLVATTFENPAQENGGKK